ncbi:ferric reductase-like transmembrane domain-containing protein [Winogradskya humida]|uniref:Ferric oxidoreductase domain-containing protein n=1 Tax=Winogradskya humida TaxID=113566 RepID=A0ABQ3ZTV0_9ACTN|nr:ferric reductase-like transmembrane domain-containing protein [Actinoplanes humidus]GIE22005.1 hypothetical protein Ahu01nite_051070 [Actinoplanes humidus]
MTDALWYFGRGTGLVSLVLLSIVVALGIGARSGQPAFGLPRFAVNLLHRNAALLAVVFLVGHVVSLYFDPYAQLRFFDLLVPFAGTYRPLWLGLGTLAFDLIIALIVTSLLRQRLGARAWRAVHWLAYLCWPIAVLHGLQTGTDGGTWWLRTVTAISVAFVLAALTWRLTPAFNPHPTRAPRRRPTPDPTHAEQAYSERIRAGQAERVRAGQGRAGKVQAGQGQAERVRAGQGRAGQVQAGRGQAERVQAGRGQAERVQAGRVHVGPVRAGQGQGQAEQVRSGQVRSEQVQAGQVHVGPVRAGQGQGQGQADQVRSGQVRDGQVRDGQVGDGQSRRHESRAGQGRAAGGLSEQGRSSFRGVW